MKNLNCTINFQVDKRDKEEASNLLKDLGLNMSTYFNMALKQLIKKGEIPFEIDNLKPSLELLEALEEGEKIIQEIKEGKRTGYKNMNDLIKALNED